jgi:hypothetical protein
MVKMPANTPIPRTHLGKAPRLIAIATPKIILVAASRSGSQCYYYKILNF